ncbi:MAG: type II restriction endonuclease subunit M [Chloroflexi bacterium]|nr:MAG: type II restriction endonuclease subunit M [Chloroflexota bacterium]
MKAQSRFAFVSEEKSEGATYTPTILANFVASKIVEAFNNFSGDRPLRILDPAVGDGELLISLLRQLLIDQPEVGIKVYGFETNERALDRATWRLKRYFPDIELNFEEKNFLEFVIEQFGINGSLSLFSSQIQGQYDLIIANPPYVRTQIMGARQAQLLSKQFGLSGRVDLYYAFILAIAEVLKPTGIAGIIVSNRFMTTKSGASVRKALLERFNILHVWDLGDTKLFDVAVLPAVLLVEGKNGHKQGSTAFTSIYQTSEAAFKTANDPISALAEEGVLEISDGRHFYVQHGKLDTGDTPDGVWRIATETIDTWLATVNAHSWGTFRDIGKIRVGVKTCADKVFIRNDWQELPEELRPELLKPVTTHHIARRFKPLTPDHPRQILYTHEVVEGRRRAVDLSKYPRSKAYLERYRSLLKGREYVIKAGRAWYEIWVPQNPDAWGFPKLVFRDIAEKPTFWLDLDGSVVNGDCYWLICENPEQTDLLWLAAAVGNSTFIECFYDRRFHNKLYAGRRRFITQYVEKFPLPDPNSPISKAIISSAKKVYECTPSSEADLLQKKLDVLVWQAFGLVAEEVCR